MNRYHRCKKRIQRRNETKHTSDRRALVKVENNSLDHYEPKEPLPVLLKVVIPFVTTFESFLCLLSLGYVKPTLVENILYVYSQR
jgi:hypothetical protein